MSADNPKKKLGKPHNVRLESTTEQRLRLLGEKLGVPMSVLVRNAVQDKLPQWETSGVQLVELV